jgi:hypothetical protein
VKKYCMPIFKDRFLCILVVLPLLLNLIWFSGVVHAERSTPKVVIIEIHGMKQGVLDENLADLPNFREMLKGPRNEQSYVFFPRVFVTIPAASVPGISSMYTGLNPRHTGVVATIWFDRRTHNVRTMISYQQQRINDLLTENNVKTLFDYVAEAGKRSMTTMLMVTKGVEWSLRSGAFFWGNASVLGLFEKGFFFPSCGYVDERTIRAFVNGHLFSYSKSLKGIIEYDHTVPDVMAIQLLGTDLFAHYPSRELREQNASMDDIQKHYAREVLDPLMGNLIRSLKEAGCYDDVIFVFVSEHGFTKIERKISDDTLDISLRPYFALPGVNTDKRKAEAVVLPGACTKEVYLKNRATGNWLDPPRLLADVKPAVDILIDNPDIKQCMKSLVIRQYSGERDEGIKERDLWWCFDWETYRSGPRDNLSFIEALQPLNRLANQFELKDYLVESLNNQYTRETAPDLKIINKEGFYFESDRRKYGHHGSFYPGDCIVSSWIGGPGLASVISGQHVYDNRTSTLDLVPMVTYLLGTPQPEGLEGTNPLERIVNTYDEVNNR